MLCRDGDNIVNDTNTQSNYNIKSGHWWQLGLPSADAVTTTCTSDGASSSSSSISRIVVDPTSVNFVSPRVHSKLKGQNSRTFQGLLKDLKLWFSSTKSIDKGISYSRCDQSHNT